MAQEAPPILLWALILKARIFLSYLRNLDRLDRTQSGTTFPVGTAFGCVVAPQCGLSVGRAAPTPPAKGWPPFGYPLKNDNIIDKVRLSCPEYI